MKKLFIILLATGLVACSESKPKSHETEYNWTLKVSYKESKTDTFTVTSTKEPYLNVIGGHGVIRVYESESEYYSTRPVACYVTHFEIIDKKIHEQSRITSK